MKTISTSRRASGFTITDMLILLGAVGLLVSWAYYGPAWRKPRGRGNHMHCISNQKQISLAFRMWSNDHHEKFPWRLSVTNGGTLEYAMSAEVFRHFQAVSNELGSPRVLVCHVDRKRQRTNRFESTFFSNINISYFVGLDTDETQPDTILSGDRNAATNGVAMKGPIALLHGGTRIGWTKELHTNFGYIALADGSANQYTAEQFRRQVALASNAVVRLAIP